MRRLTSPLSWQPWRHWKRAECSESTGTTSAPWAAAPSITSSPPQTRVSLLARAMRLPRSTAARVGLRPTTPTTAVITVSARSRVAASMRPSGPEATRTEVSARRTRRSSAAAPSIITASSGLNRRAWASTKAASRLAVSAATVMPHAAITSNDCRPMEPVEPRIEICLCMKTSPCGASRNFRGAETICRPSAPLGAKPAGIKPPPRWKRPAASGSESQ